MHGNIAAGFGVLKAKFDKDMAGPMGKWVTDYRLTDLGNNEVMCCMNVTDMDALGAFMSDPFRSSMGQRQRSCLQSLLYARNWLALI